MQSQVSRYHSFVYLHKASRICILTFPTRYHYEAKQYVPTSSISLGGDSVRSCRNTTAGHFPAFYNIVLYLPARCWLDSPTGELTFGCRA